MPARVEIRSLMDVVSARRRGLEMALALGFSRPDATKIAVVISELGRNILLYTRGGTLTLIAHHTGKKGFKIIAQDQGPGFQDLDAALGEGHSTSDGLGLGISGSRRLMDEFEIRNVAGAGTTIIAIKWLKRPSK
jgi:serine/threonine-protein kinase RsbT